MSIFITWPLFIKKHPSHTRAYNLSLNKKVSYLHGGVLLFLYGFEIETWTMWQSSSFMYACFHLLQTQGTIHICTWWHGTPMGQSDPSLTFVRGSFGGVLPFLPYFPS